MNYLFDASAIFRAIKENKTDALAGNGTVELARYELINIIWKNYFLQAKISKEETKIIAKAVKHTLRIMEVLEIVDKEEQILETATELNITFYDASYVYLAKEKDLQLITEDLRLKKKIPSTIHVSTLDEI